VTKDIASLQMEESDAEQMKLKHASAYTENSEIDNSLKYSIDLGRQVESSRFIEIVEGRMEEIIENVRYQIPTEYYDKLLGGIILTGGGSNMRNIEKAFTTYTHIDKVRVAKFVTLSINSGNEQIKAHNGMYNTVLGLLAKGDINCAGQPINANADLFAENNEQPTTADTRSPRQPHEMAPGAIRTAEEEKRAEEEARLKKEEEERLQREEEEKAAEEARRHKKENSWWNRAKNIFNKFVKEATAPE
jgi:cell division protein FtsA